jgi:hypothetical protein
MFGSEILEVAIGLSLIYALLASICSLLRERAEAVLKTRAVDLERGIRELLADPDGALAQKIYNSPLVNGLFVGSYQASDLKGPQGDKRMPRGTNLPSYIPSKQFVAGLLDTIGGTSLAEQRAAAEKIGNETVRDVVLHAIDTASGDLARVRSNLETWFNNGMDQVSGWYKRRAHNVIMLLAFGVTLAVNANTLTIIERLSIDDSLRAALVQQAGSTGAQGNASGGTGTVTVADPYRQLGELGLPLGWEGGWPGARGNPLVPAPAGGVADSWTNVWYWILHPLIGLLLTGFAVSLGAPMWFDIMNRLISLRSALKPADTPAPAPANVTVQMVMPAASADPASDAAAVAPVVKLS